MWEFVVEIQRKTKRERNSEIDKIELYRPFAFYIVILTCLNVAAIKSGGIRFTQTVAFVSIGLLIWGLYEYAVHRWVLHHEPSENGFDLPGNRTHLKHHADPLSLERLSVQLSESVPVSVVYCLIAWAVTGSWQAMTYLYTGLMAGYFFYEYLDFQAHHGMSRSRFVRYFRKYHLMHHHYDAKVRYGVTSPLFDYIFGTYHITKATKPRRIVQPRQEMKSAAAAAQKA
jgi:sterol desaturase/sphingolipid hydroxylase (fatty acid hydroxylase superfamily)